MLRTQLLYLGDEQVCLLQEPEQRFLSDVKMRRIARLHISFVDDIEPGFVTLLVLGPGFGKFVLLPFGQST